MKTDEDSTDELPIFKKVRSKKILEIVGDKQAEKEIKFAMDVLGLAEKYRSVVSKPDKNGKIVLPKFVFDIENREASLNGKTLNLSPDTEKVRNDAELFIQYLRGYERFYGDYREMQKNYFNFLNRMFCSPFMVVMRDTASRCGKEYSFGYPVFGLICGNSKGGKSKFLALCMKMMSGMNENEFSFA